MMGVPQGDPPVNSYPDDPLFPTSDVEPPPLYETVLLAERVATGLLPACRHLDGGMPCARSDRACRTGLAILALTDSSVVFKNDDREVRVALSPGLHVFSWCLYNLDYRGLEFLDPPPPCLTEGFGHFTVSSASEEDYTWLALSPSAHGGNPSYEYGVEIQPPRRVACLYRAGYSAGAYLQYPHRVDLSMYMPTAMYHQLALFTMPVGGPLMSSVGGIIVDV